MADPKIEERKCPNCGAPLRFDPEKGMLYCDFCDSSFTVEAAEAAEEAHGINEYAGSVAAANEKLAVYICKSCGAEVVADPERVALTCPYCGNNIVLSDKLTGKLVPDGVIPFKITPDTLPEAVRRFYKGKKLLPKQFFSDSSIGKVQGVYVPFWLYDCDMLGDISYDGCKNRSFREGDYIITESSHFDVRRRVSMHFEKIPADASARMDDALMDSLEPYDYSEIKAFDTSYLAGYVADRFDKEAGEVRERADSRILRSAIDVTRSTVVGYDSVMDGEAEMSGSTKTSVRYILLPVYLLNISFRNKDYSFAVNGQTGKVVGELPADKATERGWFWKRFGIIFGILTLLQLLSELL